jgi:hypothetical protein
MNTALLNHRWYRFGLAQIFILTAIAAVALIAPVRARGWGVVYNGVRQAQVLPELPYHGQTKGYYGAGTIELEPASYWRPATTKERAARSASAVIVAICLWGATRQIKLRRRAQ